MEVISRSLENTKDFAKEIAELIENHPLPICILLFGDLGSGKTTFTSILVKELGFKDRVQSPTFVIHRVYNQTTSDNIKKINHLDLYRLTSETELEDLDLKEILEEPGSVNLIEWPEVAKKIMPKNTVCIYFEYLDETTRRIYVENCY